MGMYLNVWISMQSQKRATKSCIVVSVAVDLLRTRMQLSIVLGDLQRGLQRKRAYQV